jgi:PelA/Pel-15E family pectate lyase
MMIKYIKKTVLAFLIFSGLNAQNAVNDSLKGPELSRFDDSSRHWYRIFDDERVIEPIEGQKQYKQQEYVKIADNILLFQKDNGGWAKNYDMCAILSDEQKQAVIKSKSDLNTTFDNGATHGQLTYLAEVYSLTGEQKYKQAFANGLDFILDAQYDNGGWPQFYPDTSGYRKHITFNDNAMIGVMEMFQHIDQNDPDYRFIDGELKERIIKSYHKGIECILKCQIAEQGKKTAWCQQHDHIDYKPRDARVFEKASICNLESSEIVKFLMQIDDPRKEIIDAVENAVQWFRDSEIYGIREKWIESTEEQFIYHKTKYDKIVVEDPQAPRIWARFYELVSHKPIFCGRDGIVRYSMAEIDRDRRTGYGWYNYAPEEVYTLYEQWHKSNH